MINNVIVMIMLLTANFYVIKKILHIVIRKIDYYVCVKIALVG